MIEETARVIDIEGDQLVLQAQTKTACNACEVKQGCGTSVLSKVVGRKFTRFHATNTVNANIGDEVIVGLHEDAMLMGSVMVYLLPLLALIIAAVVADSLIAATALTHRLLDRLRALGVLCHRCAFSEKAQRYHDASISTM